MKIDDAVTIAVNESRKSNAKYHLGAVIFDSIRYVTGYNRNLFCTHQRKATPDSVHAEEMAIQRALRAEMDFNCTTMVVIRINNAGVFRCSYPCEHCRKLINSLGIRTVYYCK